MKDLKCVYVKDKKKKKKTNKNEHRLEVHMIQANLSLKFIVSHG